jgi:hypothetical protein
MRLFHLPSVALFRYEVDIEWGIADGVSCRRKGLIFGTTDVCVMGMKDLRYNSARSVDLPGLSMLAVL